MDILERLSGYNPPDRVNDEAREIAIDIQDAKNEIERLRKIIRGLLLVVDGNVTSLVKVEQITDAARSALPLESE